MITSFQFNAPEAEGVIQEDDHSIKVVVPYETNIKALSPQIEFVGRDISPRSNEPLDFSEPVIYTVYAEDSSSVEYTVSVDKALPIKKNLKVLILGNSITKHPPSSEIGWEGNWGMAASSIEHDYVHVLFSKLNDFYPNTNIDYLAQNIANWEHNFVCDSLIFDTINSYHPDILIVRLGENVDEYQPSISQYYDSLTQVIQNASQANTQVIISGNFWTSTYKDSIQQQVATDHMWNYVDFTRISKDNENYAYGLFDNLAVAHHPSDKGMNEIALVLFDEIKHILLKTN